VYESWQFETPAQLALLEPKIKFIDFGSSYFIDAQEDRDETEFNENYADPDILKHNSIASQESDAWALGCLLYELRSGRLV
jgi:serine/threonine protein kinase